MNSNQEVASLELCVELYALTGWEETEKLRCLSCGDVIQQGAKIDDGRMHKSAPAYTLGYLLRKLPIPCYIYRYNRTIGAYCAYLSHNYTLDKQFADTPEDATAKLCIELAKQGLLEKEQDNA